MRDVFGGRFARYPWIAFLMWFALAILVAVLLTYLRSLSEE
jgi:uncharacterized membrane protein YdfJ with MMPL/SSD domain